MPTSYYVSGRKNGTAILGMASKLAEEFFDMGGDYKRRRTMVRKDGTARTRFEKINKSKRTKLVKHFQTKYGATYTTEGDLVMEYQTH